MDGMARPADSIVEQVWGTRPMTNFARIAALAVVAAAVSTPALAVPAGTPVSPNANAKASINVKKPLTLTLVDDMSFGNVTVLDNGTITMARDGTITCNSAQLTCASTGTPAKYNVTGTNQQVVKVNTASTVTLTNPTSDTLTLNLDAPGTVTLTNAGAPGTDFTIGGNIALLASTPEGLYTGDLDVTVEY